MFVQDICAKVKKDKLNNSAKEVAKAVIRHNILEVKLDYCVVEPLIVVQKL